MRQTSTERLSGTRSGAAALLLAALLLTASVAPGGAAETSEAASSMAGLEQMLGSRPRLDRALTVDDAVGLALRESPVVRGAVREVEAAAGRLEAARAERRPWASINTFLGGGSAANIVNSPDAVQPRMAMGLPGGGFLDQNVSLMLPLSTGGRLRAMVRQARAMRGASEAELAAVRQDVELMVRLAYREAQARQSFVGVYQALLEQNRERQRIDLIAYEQQKIPRFYTLRNAAEVANAEQMLTNARRDVEISLVQLKTLMGVHLESRLELTEPLEAEPVSAVLAAYGCGESGAELETARLLEIAARNRPELQAAERRLDGGREGVRVAKSAYRPQIGAGVMGDLMKMRGESPFLGSTFAIVGSLPILDGGSRKAKLHTAEAEAARLQEESNQVALRVGQEVTTALLSLRAAAQNVETARSAVTAAVEDYRVALLRYTAGRGIHVEALDALTAQVRAQNNEIQALYEYHVARDQLARALGLLGGTGERLDTARPEHP